jgi:hypothetical protein
MEDQPAHGPTFEPLVEVRSPRVYGSFPRFSACRSPTPKRTWRAPTSPSWGCLAVRPRRRAPCSSGERANFEGTQLTPSYFRLNSLNYGGYLPELDLDVFEHLRLVDRGNADVF